MKTLRPHTLDPAQARAQWNELVTLLTSKPTLSERRDVLPFFKTRLDLSLLICSYFPKIKVPDRVAHEYQIDGEFVADLVVGDSSVHHYLLAGC